MTKLCLKCKDKLDSLAIRFRTAMSNIDGDQITGWLIVVLIVVVVGAVFMKTYQSAITDLWSDIMKKIKSSFGV